MTPSRSDDPCTRAYNYHYDKNVMRNQVARQIEIRSTMLRVTLRTRRSYRRVGVTRGESNLAETAFDHADDKTPVMGFSGSCLVRAFVAPKQANYMTTPTRDGARI